jgi:hypothetical protein
MFFFQSLVVCNIPNFGFFYLLHVRNGGVCESIVVEKKSMGGEMSFRPLVRSHHSFTSR